jgi:hypothetical protein
MISAPTAIFQQAQTAWEARRLPAYIEFDVSIRHRDAGGTVTTGEEHVLLRAFDHWCKTREIDSDSAKVKTSIGPSCVGPALSPLGFNIAAQYPASTQIDPFVSPLRTIASTHAAHYNVTYAGEAAVDSHECYHLLLTPIASPAYYPLRAVWVDEKSSEVRRLTYEMHQNGWSASIDYSFRWYQSGPAWWISEIDANWTPPARDHSDVPFSSTLQLTNVTFPAAP